MTVLFVVFQSNHTEQQQKAMQHGVDLEKHEIATLTGIVLPFMFPNLEYREEGINNVCCVKNLSFSNFSCFFFHCCTF